VTSSVCYTYCPTAKHTTTSHAWASSTPPPRPSNSAWHVLLLQRCSHRARMRPVHRHEDRHRPTQTPTQKTPSPHPRPPPRPHPFTRPHPRLATPVSKRVDGHGRVMSAVQLFSSSHRVRVGGAVDTGHSCSRPVRASQALNANGAPAYEYMPSAGMLCTFFVQD
jgi:hypothetical protein